MKVAELMNQLVLTVTPDTHLRQVNQLLHRYNQNSLVVLDGNKLAGIVTFTDLFRKLLPSYDEVVQNIVYWTQPEVIEKRMGNLINLPVKEVMTKKVITVPPDMAAVQAGALMNIRKIKQMPVVDPETEKVVGMVSYYDITWGLMMKHCKYF